MRSSLDNVQCVHHIVNYNLSLNRFHGCKVVQFRECGHNTVAVHQVCDFAAASRTDKRTDTAADNGKRLGAIQCIRCDVVVHNIVTWTVIVLGYLISMVSHAIDYANRSSFPSSSSSSRFYSFNLYILFCIIFLLLVAGCSRARRNYVGERTKCALLIWCVRMFSTNKFIRYLHHRYAVAIEIIRVLFSFFAWLRCYRSARSKCIHSLIALNVCNSAIYINFLFFCCSRDNKRTPFCLYRNTKNCAVKFS